MGQHRWRAGVKKGRSGPSCTSMWRPLAWTCAQSGLYSPARHAVQQPCPYVGYYGTGLAALHIGVADISLRRKPVKLASLGALQARRSLVMLLVCIHIANAI